MGSTSTKIINNTDNRIILKYGRNKDMMCILLPGDCTTISEYDVEILDRSFDISGLDSYTIYLWNYKMVYKSQPSDGIKTLNINSIGQ